MLDFDIDKMCRICLQTNLELFLLFDEQNAIDGVCLSNMISEMTMFTVRRHDDFPHQICFECMQRVRSAYELKKQFERSHRKLLTYLESMNKITIDTIPDIKNDKCIQTEDSTLFPCEKCDDMFVSYQNLRDHRVAAHKGTANNCRFCFKKFNRIGDLRNHIAVHHPDIKHFNPQECLICNRRFARKEHLNRHMEKIHKIENRQMSGDEDNIIFEKKSDANELEMLIETEMDYGNLTKGNVTSEILSNKDLKEYDSGRICAAENPFTEMNYENLTKADVSSKILSNKDLENYDSGSIGAAENPFAEMDYGNLTKADVNSEILSNKDHEDYDIGSTGAAENSFSSDEDDKPLADLLSKINEKNKDLENISIKEELDCCTEQPNCVPKLEEIEIDNKFDLMDVENSHEVTKKFKCSICYKSFKRNSTLKRHSYTHEKDKEFPCKMCGKRYSRADNLKSHMNIHDEKKVFKCNLCDRAYHRAGDLKTHNEKKHSLNGQPDHVNSEYCELCKKSFSSKAYLQKHMDMHTNNAWKCKLCPVGFGSREALRKHNRSHAKEKPYLCSECGLRFLRHDYMLIHMRRHTGEKPYKCKYCDKAFPRGTDLNVHVKYHTGEKSHLCTICGKGFQRSYNLVVHMRVHTGERPYQCSQCPRNFAQGNDLKAHIRRHTGERFKCEICGVGFVQGYLLTQHKISVHKVEGEARKGRVLKVKPNKSLEEIVSEAVDEFPNDIKTEK